MTTFHRLYFIGLGAILLISCQQEHQAPRATAQGAVIPQETTEMIKRVHRQVELIDLDNVPYVLNKKKLARIEEKLASAPGSETMQLRYTRALELLRTGRHDNAIAEINEVLDVLQKNNYQDKQTLYAIQKALVIAYMRKAEVENCIANHTDASCIMPFAKEAQHIKKEGARKAIALTGQLLESHPDDYELQYINNVANMLLGTYPDQVPERYRLPVSYFEKGATLPPFKDVAMDVGVSVNDLAGGTCIDDFNNDGYLDIIASSWGYDDQIRYFENDKNGGFTDRTRQAALSGVTGGLNIKHADYNNDGHMDFIILRGAWLGKSGKIPNSLMRNNGDGTFTDVTIASNLYSERPTQSAVWADFDRNGWIDLFVANESTNQPFTCELFMNNEGKFVELAVPAGINAQGFFKGVACGDVNNDGNMDLYLSDYDSDNKLYLNLSKGDKILFQDITAHTKTGAPQRSFSTWMFDYDNNGTEDIFVSGYSDIKNSPAAMMVSYARENFTGNRPVVYKNNGDGSFEDVAVELQLSEPVTTMGCNYGDLNNDGYLDFYLATGDPSFYSIVPNKMYLNKAGKRFEDITFQSGFGHVQKGHAIGFGDLDADGDQDIYAVMGGAFEGDNFSNLLFENPIGNENNWINIILEGTLSNRSAIGAKMAIIINDAGNPRTIFHTVGMDASFGGNSLMAEVGLGKAEVIDRIEIRWPNKNLNTSTHNNIAVNQTIRITEGKEIIEKIDISPTTFRKRK